MYPDVSLGSIARDAAIDLAKGTFNIAKGVVETAVDVVSQPASDQWKGVSHLAKYVRVGVPAYGRGESPTAAVDGKAHPIGQLEGTAFVLTIIPFAASIIPGAISAAARSVYEAVVSRDSGVGQAQKGVDNLRA